MKRFRPRPSPAMACAVLALVVGGLVPATAVAQGPPSFSGTANFTIPPRIQLPLFLPLFNRVIFSQPQPGAALPRDRGIVVEGTLDLLRGRVKPGSTVRINAFDGAGNPLRFLGAIAPRCLQPCPADGAKHYAFGPATLLPADPNVVRLRAEATTQFQGDSTVSGEVAVGGAEAGPAPDIIAGGIEVNQVVASPNVQDPGFGAPPSIRTANLTGPPFVGGKTTLVRVPLLQRSDPPTSGVDAVLTGTKNGVALSGSPLRPLATATAVASGPSRTTSALENLLTGGRVLVWRLPRSWSGGGPIELDVSVNPPSLPPAQRVRECAGCVNNNNRYKATVTFKTAPARELRLAPYRIAEESPGGSVQQETRALDPLADVGERFFPLPDDGLSFAAEGAPVRTSSPDCGIQAGLIAIQHLSSGAAGLPLGVLRPGSSCVVGGNPFTADDDVSVPGVHVSIPGLGVSIARLDDGGLTLVHELGHAFGLAHASCDHGEEDGGGCEARFPNRHGSLGGTGIDPIAGTLIAPGDPDSDAHPHDILSYGANRWMSPVTFQRLETKLAAAARDGIVSAPRRAARAGAPTDALAAALGPTPEQGSDRLLVAVEVSPGDVARLGPVVALDRGPVLPLSSSGRYALTALDAAGATIAEHRFEPSGLFAHGPGLALAAVSFPRASEIATLVVSRDGTELLRRDRSGADPTVQWTDPSQPKPFGTRGVRRVAWTAGDGDGDKLSYLVQFSPDGGRTWRGLAPAVDGLSYDVDLATLPATNRGRFRVVASDGLRGAIDAAGKTVRIPNHPPGPGIATPDGLTVQAGAGITLAGGATDVDEPRPLSGRRLNWSSNRDGALGRGSRLTTAALSIGTHRVTLTARDRKGATARARVTVRVEVRPSPDRTRPRARRARRRPGGSVEVRLSEPIVGAGPRAFRIVGGPALTATAAAAAGASATIVLRPASGRLPNRPFRLRVSSPLSDLAGNAVRRATLRVP